MARPTIEELTGLDTRTLKHLPFHEASKKIIDALVTRKVDIAVILRDNRFRDGFLYEEIVGLSNEIKYINRALDARASDYEMMMADIDLIKPISLMRRIMNILKMGAK